MYSEVPVIDTMVLVEIEIYSFHASECTQLDNVVVIRLQVSGCDRREIVPQSCVQRLNPIPLDYHTMTIYGRMELGGISSELRLVSPSHHLSQHDVYISPPIKILSASSRGVM
jgi:hypothetical protein